MVIKSSRHGFVKVMGLTIPCQRNEQRLRRFRMGARLSRQFIAIHFRQAKIQHTYVR